MSVDNRIVKMEFDNNQFKTKIKETQSLLDKFKNKLNFSKSSESLKQLNTETKKVDMSGIAKGVSNISNKFSTLGIVGITVIQNLTNSAMQFGKQMAKSMSVDPVLAGLDEYETKMNAIKVILANTSPYGTTLEDVNIALKELNDYSDQTVYNFAQMTEMVGKFAATSGDLDSSVSIVKGLANLAAEAGVENAKLQGALYQVSQAMSGSYFQKMDWNSLENANIATKGFRTDLIAMGEEMGAFKEIPEVLRQLKEGTLSLGMSLEEKWLSTEVFAAVTEMYALDDAMTAAAGDVITLTKLFVVMKEIMQSGWTESWEQIIGDQSQSIKLLNAVRDAFQELKSPAMDARNATLEFWNQNGGRRSMIIALAEGFGYLLDVLEPIKQAFREVFPPATGEMLVSMSKSLQTFAEGLDISHETSYKLKQTFKGLFSIVKIVKNVIGGFVSVLSAMIGGIDTGGYRLLDFTSALGTFLINLSDAIEKTTIFDTTIQLMLPTIKFVQNAFRGLIDATDDFIEAIDANKILEGVELALIGIGVTSKSLFDTLSSASGGESLSKMTEGISESSDGLFNAVENSGRSLTVFKDKFDAFLQTISYEKVAQVLKDGIFGGGFILIIKRVSDMMKEGADIMGGVTGVLDGVRGTLKAYQADIKADALIKVAGAVLILSGAMILLSTIESGKLESAIIAMGSLFLGMSTALKALNTGLTTRSSANLAILSVVLISLSASILVLAGAMKLISGLNMQEITNGLMGLAGISGILIGVSKAMSKSTAGMIKGSAGIIVFAGAMLILLPVLSRMKEIDPKELFIFAGALVVLGLAMRAMGGSFAGAAGLAVMALAIRPLVESLRQLGELDLVKTMKGLALLGATLLMLAVSATAMTSLAPAILALSGSILALGAGVALAGAGVVLFASGLTSMVAALGLAVAAGIPMVKAIVQSIVSFFKGIAANAVEIGDAIEIILLETLRTISNIIPEAVLIFADMITRLILVLIDAIPKFAKAAMELIITINKTIRANIGTITKLGIDILLGFIDGLMMSMGNLVDAAFKLVIAFIDGLTLAIDNNVMVLATSLQKMFLSVLKASFKIFALGIKGFRDIMYAIMGAILKAIFDRVSSIVDGILWLKDKIVEFFEPIIDKFWNIGKDLVMGLVNGIKNAAKEGVEAIKNFGDDVLVAFKDKLGVASPSKEFAYVGYEIVNGVAVGVEKNTPLATKSVKQMGDDMVRMGGSKGDDFVDTFVDRLFGTEAKKLMEDSASDVGEDTVEAQADGMEQGLPAVSRASTKVAETYLQKQKEAIDEKKFYNQMSLMEELEAWQEIQAHYDEGTEERKKADREVYTLKKNLTSQMEQIEEEYETGRKSRMEQLKADIRSVKEEYRQAVDDRADAIYNSFGLFDELKATEPMDAATLTKNLYEQVAVINRWRKDIEGLTERGVSDELMKELTEMGPESASQIAVLNNMTDEELTKYVTLWSKKHRSARVQAATELQGMQDDIKTKTRELIEVAGNELDGLKETYLTKMAELRGSSVDEVEEMRSKWDQEIKTLRTNTEGEFDKLQNNIVSLDWKKTGQDMIYGMASGVRSKADYLARTARAAARQALNAAKEEIDANSPSREFMKLGKWSIEGLALGFDKFSNISEDASRSAASRTIDAMQKALSNVNLLTENIDSNPKITPVVDLSEVRKGVTNMNSMFGSKSATMASFTANNTGENVSSTPNSKGSTDVQPKEINYVQNNYSPKALSRIEIYRQTRNQIRAVNV